MGVITQIKDLDNTSATLRFKIIKASTACGGGGTPPMRRDGGADVTNIPNISFTP